MTAPVPPPPGGPRPAPPAAYPAGYGQPAPARRTSGLAIASLVLGIVGVATCFIFVPSILAVVFGGVALNQIKKEPELGGRGMAIAGLVLGIVTLVLYVLLVAVGSVSTGFDTGLR